jgi:hypothetical protein
MYRSYTYRQNCGQSDFLIKSSQQRLGDGVDADMAHDATSIQQSAEWGMAQFQASFPQYTAKSNLKSIVSIGSC